MRYFTLNELCRSDKAERLGIANNPNTEQQNNLISLVEDVLDPARIMYGKAICVSSGFRCAKLNSAVGGETNSQHKQGQAADLYTKDGAKGNLELAKTIIRLGRYDQLILENVGPNDLLPQWVHVSWRSDGKNRRQILKKVAGKKGYMALTKNALI